MWMEIVEDIEKCIDSIDVGEFDISLMPLEKWIMALSEAAGDIGDDSEKQKESIMILLNCATNMGSMEALRAVLVQLKAYLKNASVLSNEKEMLDHYSWIVFHRLPGYNYFINERRNRKSSEVGESRLFPLEGKAAVYTVITGDYDAIPIPKVVNKDWDYILFTDNTTIKSDFWDVRYLKEDGLDNVRLSRKPKILGHKYLNGYDFSIYIDGKISIIGDLNEYIKKYSNGKSLLCVGHYLNIDIYEEAALCKYLGKGRQDEIDKQIAEYKAKGFPAGYGLTDNCVLIRSLKDEKLNKVMEDWWDELCRHSSRDQLSFTYCCWKNGYLFDIAPVLVDENPYFDIVAHKI